MPTYRIIASCIKCARTNEDCPAHGRQWSGNERCLRSSLYTLTPFYLASFPGSSAWAEKKEPGTHGLRMLSSPRISGNLEISVKSAPLHQPLQGMPTSPV